MCKGLLFKLEDDIETIWRRGALVSRLRVNILKSTRNHCQRPLKLDRDLRRSFSSLVYKHMDSYSLKASTTMMLRLQRLQSSQESAPTS